MGFAGVVGAGVAVVPGLTLLLLGTVVPGTVLDGDVVVGLIVFCLVVVFVLVVLVPAGVVRVVLVVREVLVRVLSVCAWAIPNARIAPNVKINFFIFIAFLLWFTRLKLGKPIGLTTLFHIN